MDFQLSEKRLAIQHAVREFAEPVDFHFSQ